MDTELAATLAASQGSTILLHKGAVTPAAVAATAIVILASAEATMRAVAAVRLWWHLPDCCGCRSLNEVTARHGSRDFGIAAAAAAAAAEAETAAVTADMCRLSSRSSSSES